MNSLHKQIRQWRRRFLLKSTGSWFNKTIHDVNVVIVVMTIVFKGIIKTNLGIVVVDVWQRETGFIF